MRDGETAATEPELVRHWQLTTGPDGVRRVRGDVRDQSASWGISPRDTEDIVLVADELLSNAVAHAAGPVMLTLRVGPKHVYVGVLDRSPGSRPPRSAVVRPEAESGRGLAVVGALASYWGSERQTRTSKLVWATVPRRPAS